MSASRFRHSLTGEKAFISDLYPVFCSVLFPKTWSEFVTCIKRYTSDCLTPDQVTAVTTPSSAATLAL